MSLKSEVSAIPHFRAGGVGPGAEVSNTGERPFFNGLLGHEAFSDPMYSQSSSLLAVKFVRSGPVKADKLLGIYEDLVETRSACMSKTMAGHFHSRESATDFLAFSSGLARADGTVYPLGTGIGMGHRSKKAVATDGAGRALVSNLRMGKREQKAVFLGAN